jgi:hypothetical protein
MKGRPIALAIVIAIAAALMGATSSGATTAAPAAVSIDLFPTQFCCPQEIGTWQATGAINESGSYVRTGGRATGSFPSICPPTHTGAFMEEFSLTSSRGTLTIKAEELVSPVGDLCFPPSYGVWQVEAGTGAYAGVSGHGTSQFFMTPVFDLSLTGVISQAH